MTPGPFRVRCLLCGTVAESWHRALSVPPGATVGMASCECKNLMVDSLGIAECGRILCPESSEAPYLIPPYQVLKTVEETAE